MRFSHRHFSCLSSNLGWAELWKRINQTMMKHSQYHGTENERKKQSMLRSKGDVPRKQKRRDAQDEDSGLGYDLWVELPMTMAIAFCISAAVGLIQKAIRIPLKSFVLPA